MHFRVPIRQPLEQTAHSPENQHIAAQKEAKFSIGRIEEDPEEKLRPAEDRPQRTETPDYNLNEAAGHESLHEANGGVYGAVVAMRAQRMLKRARMIERVEHALHLLLKVLEQNDEGVGGGRAVVVDVVAVDGSVDAREQIGQNVRGRAVVDDHAARVAHLAVVDGPVGLDRLRRAHQHSRIKHENMNYNL